MREESLENMIKRISRKINIPFPYSVNFEITQRCNLKCHFCYLGNQKHKEPDIQIDKIFSIIEQLKEIGCIEINLLGGEPLLRKDFPDIYKYIKEQGLLVSIWTNGTLITPRIANLFKNYPPHHVRISLYAGSYEGYEKIAERGEAFEMIKKGAGLLKEKGVYFTFRSLITKINFNELDKMEKFAKSLGAKFWVRTTITTTTKREFNPSKFKITLEQQLILSKDMRKDLLLKWEKKEQRKLRTRGCDGCFHIANNGHLLACTLYRNWYNYDLEKLGVRQAWEKRLKKNIKIKCPCL